MEKLSPIDYLFTFLYLLAKIPANYAGNFTDKTCENRTNYSVFSLDCLRIDEVASQVGDVFKFSPTFSSDFFPQLRKFNNFFCTQAKISPSEDNEINLP